MVSVGNSECMIRGVNNNCNHSEYRSPSEQLYQARRNRKIVAIILTVVYVWSQSEYGTITFAS